MDLLNNWLIQAIIGNLVWLILAKIFKWFRDNSQIKNKEIINDKEYSKILVKKQFSVCFWIASISTIILLVILLNQLQNKYSFLFVFLIIIVFWCYILMLGAFEASFKYMPDDKFNHK